MDVEQLWAERVVVAGSVGIHCVQRTRASGRCFEVKTDRLPIGPNAAYKGLALQRANLTPRRPLRRLAVSASRRRGGELSLLDAQRLVHGKTTDQFVEAKVTRAAPGCPHEHRQ